jgi:Transposase and inactivated derivatives
MAEDRVSAHKAFDHFVQTYQARYPKAVACLEKDREVLLAFYDFPAEHWMHIRATSLIESTFATGPIGPRDARAGTPCWR